MHFQGTCDCLANDAAQELHLGSNYLDFGYAKETDLHIMRNSPVKTMQPWYTTPRRLFKRAPNQADQNLLNASKWSITRSEEIGPQINFVHVLYSKLLLKGGTNRLVPVHVYKRCKVIRPALRGHARERTQEALRPKELCRVPPL